MTFGTFSSSEVLPYAEKEKKKSYFFLFSDCLVAPNSKISFPQTADETGNGEDLEVSCGSICTSVFGPIAPSSLPAGLCKLDSAFS